MEKVVKCTSDRCGQYFMHTKKDTKCPFCHTVYGKVDEKEKKLQELEKNPSKFGKNN